MLKKEFKLDTEGIDKITKDLTTDRDKDIAEIHKAKKELQWDNNE